MEPTQSFPDTDVNITFVRHGIIGEEVSVARVDTIQAGDFLRLSAQRFPDRECFVFDDGSSRSFAEVNRRVNQLAGAPHGRGVGEGDRVVILATDSGEYVEVLTLLRRAEPKAIFASARYAPRVAALAAELDTGPLASLDGEDLLPFGDLLAEGTDTEPVVGVDVLALAFTSGTTGLPKGVLQSQRMINALTLQMSVDYEILLDEFRYTASPIFHIAGQAAGAAAGGGAGVISRCTWRGRVLAYAEDPLVPISSA